MQEGIAVLSSDKNSLFLNTTVRKRSDFIYWFPLELLYFPSENNIFAIYSQLSLIFLSIATSILFTHN